MINIAKTFADLRAGIKEIIDQETTDTLTPSAKHEIQLLTQISFSALTIAECVVFDLRRMADAADGGRYEKMP